MIRPKRDSPKGCADICLEKSRQCAHPSQKQLHGCSKFIKMVVLHSFRHSAKTINTVGFDSLLASSSGTMSPRHVIYSTHFGSSIGFHTLYNTKPE
jgi:hypothetical protein